MSEKTVGYVGLGIMGLPMAKNLVDAGFSVVGFNRSKEPVEKLVEHGGAAGRSLVDVAERADVVFTCLPESETVVDVVIGDGGLADGLSSGDVVVDMSTIAPPVAREVASALDEHGVEMLDAPVSGGESGAIEGSLSTMVGGPESTFEAQRDVLTAVADTLTHCGAAGDGQVAKATHQTIVAGTLEIIAEALVMAERAGADLESVYDAVSGGTARSWLLDVHGTNMLEGDFDPGFFAEYMYGDLGYALEAAEEYGATMPAAATTHQLYRGLVEGGRGREANNAIIKVVEELSGGAEARFGDDQMARDSGVDW